MVKTKKICVKKRGLLAIALITAIVSALTLFVKLGPDEIFYHEGDRYVSEGPATGVQFTYNKNLEKKGCQIPAGTPLSFWQTDQVLRAPFFM